MLKRSILLMIFLITSSSAHNSLMANQTKMTLECAELLARINALQLKFAEKCKKMKEGKSIGITQQLTELEVASIKYLLSQIELRYAMVCPEITKN